MAKHIKITFIIIFTYACGTNLSNNRIALNVTAKGLNPKEVRVFENQTLKIDKNIHFGSQLTVEINGIEDFVAKNGTSVQIGGESTIIDEEKKVLYHIPDYFQKYALTGVPIEDAKKIKFNITMGKPMEPGKKYFFLFKVWDKDSKKELKGNIELNVI